jgi:uncharacterized protein DUF6491
MDQPMTRMAAALLAASCLTLLTAPGCSSSSPRARARADQIEADLNAPIAQSGAQVQRYRIKDWSVPNDHTVIIVTDDGARYRAQTLGPCQGLDFAQRLGFVTRGSFNQVDRFSSVVLDDGTRCALTSFDKLKTAEAKALDDYEKGDSPEKKDDSGAKPK